MLATTELDTIVQANRTSGVIVCQRLIEEINKLGFAKTITRLPQYEEATFLLIKDPFTGMRNLTGYWYSAVRSQRIGSLQFNSDGSVYAEYDIIKPHPALANWFVEGVAVWGNPAQLKVEAKLLPMPE